MKKIIWLLLLLWVNIALSQVKVGDNINTIDAASILELESSEKVFVITRMNATEMNLISPLNGAMVYNTDAKCIFVFEGAVWKSLCNSEISVTTSLNAPPNPTIGDIWINDTDNTVSIWNGANWTPITRSHRRGNGPPNATTITDAVAGDIYVDSSNGQIHAFDGTNWINQTSNATSGLSLAPNNTIEFGGALTKATEISTDNSNTLAIIGLEEVINNTNAVVTIDETTGVLRKTPISSFLQQEEIVILASDAQTQFTPPLSVTNSKKLNVYRNGVKLGFTVINVSTIQLETPVACYQNDEIRIVQFY